MGFGYRFLSLSLSLSRVLFSVVVVWLPISNNLVLSVLIDILNWEKLKLFSFFALSLVLYSVCLYPLIRLMSPLTPTSELFKPNRWHTLGANRSILLGCGGLVLSTSYDVLWRTGSFCTEITQSCTRVFFLNFDLTSFPIILIIERLLLVAAIYIPSIFYIPFFTCISFCNGKLVCVSISKRVHVIIGYGLESSIKG